MTDINSLKNIYMELHDTLKNGKINMQKLINERYLPERLSVKKGDLMREINLSLRESLRKFFLTYDEVIEINNKNNECWQNINYLPTNLDLSLEPEDERTVLKKIETLLERQQIARRLENMDDEELVAFYKNIVIRADRLRESILNQINSKEIDVSNAQELLSLDSNVKIASVIEEEGSSLIKQKHLKNALADIIGENRIKRSLDFQEVGDKKVVDTLHSSVTFLLRDHSDLNMKIIDWESREEILDDLEQRNVNFFLEQFDEIKGNIFNTQSSDKVSPNEI